MKATVKAAKGKDVRNECGDLRLVAQREADRRLLTLLYEVIFLKAGSLEIRFLDNKVVHSFHFGSNIEATK